MLTWKRFLIAICVLTILSLGFITLILPGMIVDRASSWVAEETGRNLAIESLSINPFGLTVEIENLALSDTDHAKPFVSFDLLRTSLSTSSIFRMAPVIDEFTLVNPTIQLERLTEDTFNFSDLIPQESEEPQIEQEETKPLRFSVNNININGGHIELLDESLKDPIRHEISNLQLVLPSIGNLPHMIEDPSQPFFSAELNGSPIVIEGQLTPFTMTREMTFDVELHNKEIPFYIEYIPVELPVDIRNGKLNLDLKILYRYTEETGNELILSGDASLASLNIWDNEGEQLFFLPLLQVKLAPSQPLHQKIHLSALRVYNLEVELNRDQAGRWNHARMAQVKAAPKVPEDDNNDKVGEPADPFQLAIDSVEIRDGVVNFADNLPAGGFATVAKEINIDVKDFSLDAKEGIPFKLDLKTERNEAAAVSGQFLLAPFTLNLQAGLQNIQLDAYEPYYQEFYNQPLGGTMSLDASLLINPEQPLLVSQGKIAGRNLYGAFNEEEGIAIDQLDLEGISFDMARNRLEIDSITTADAHTSFSRDKDGNWSIMSRNFPILAKLAETASQGQQTEPNLQENAKKGPEFSYRIGALDISNWQFDIIDNLPATPARIEIDDLALKIKDLIAPEKNMSPFSFGMTLQNKGRVKLDGETALADQETKVTTRLTSIPLKILAPYIAEQTNLVLTDGLLNADINAQVTPQNGKFAVSYDGKLGISRMHLLDGIHKEDLLKWDSLQVAGIRGDVSPFRLAIDSITLSDYFAKVLIDEKARLNLAEALKKGDKENQDLSADNEEKGAETESVVAEEGETETVPAEVTIDKVVLQGGSVDFTDLHLPRPFHAGMKELGGSIDGLSSSPEACANVDLRGSLRNQSPLNITGTVNPLAEDLFLDIELSFRDIEMSPFSPYSGNFVGYMIEKGKLNLALDYTIENHQLKAANKVFLDQFTFGEPVESENATSLPVKLAVALLKDGNGEIHLDIPVTGSLDDPQFSIGGVIWTVIKNLLVKAATSPFALLGAIIGGGNEDFSSISFDYGTDRLSSAEQEKLSKIAQALLERPSLMIDVSGYVDPEKDPEGYRKVKLANDIKRLKYLDLVDDGKLPEGMTEDDVTVPAEEYSDYLWEVYKEADFPKPRNFIGMTKQLPDLEMEKLIYANTDVSEDDLANLAQARALAVQNYLTEAGQMPKERIFLKKPDIAAAPEQESGYRARVELDASVR